MKKLSLPRESSKGGTILIINHLSFNKGNHAVLRTILQELAAAYGEKVKIITLSDDKSLTEFRDGVESHPWPLNIRYIKDKTWRAPTVSGCSQGNYSELLGPVWTNNDE